MTSKRTRWFVIAICAQVMLVLGMGLWKQSLIWRGREITLEASPVDPWDPFRGDYVSLSYKVGHMPVTLVPGRRGVGKDRFHVGDVLYVDIEPSGEYWSAKGAHSSMPNTGVFLKGRIETIEYAPNGNPKSITLTYGIESWFVQRGEGRKIENVQRGSRPIIAATVSLTPEGVAILRWARVAGIERPNPESTIMSPMQTP